MNYPLRLSEKVRSIYRGSTLILLGMVNLFSETYYWNPMIQTGGAEAQRAFNWTLNKDGSGGSPSSNKDDNFNGPSLDSTWTFIDWTRSHNSADPYIPASFSFPGDGTLKLTGAGSDLSWGWIEVASIYRTDIKGNFDVSVKISNHWGAYSHMKTGIIVFNDFKNTKVGGAFAVMATRDHGFVVEYDQFHDIGDFDATLNWGLTPMAPANGPYWIRAVKNGATFTGYYKLSASAPWTIVASCIPQGVTAVNSQIGLFITSHDPVNPAHVSFDEFQAGGDLKQSDLDLQFSGNTAGAQLPAYIATDFLVKNIDFTGYTGVFSFLSNTLTVSENANFGDMTQLNSGTGRLNLNGSLGQLLTAMDTLPQILHASNGTLKLGSPIRAMSLQNTSGKLDLNGNDLSIYENAAIANGTSTTMLGLDGRTITVKGNATFSGSQGNLLNLNPLNFWSLDVKGVLSADYAAIGNSSATGLIGLASASCTNVGKNINWNFFSELPFLFARQPHDTLVNMGQGASFSVQVSGPGPISYEWRTHGDTTILSRDSVLLLGMSTRADSGKSFQCRAINLNGTILSTVVKLFVNSCESFKVSVDSVSVDEGQAVLLNGFPGCAESFSWVALSGPTPKILDPAVLSLNILTPRVNKETVLQYQFVASFGSNVHSKNVIIRVRDAIPDPEFTLAPLIKWNSEARIVLRPVLSNGVILSSAKYNPLIKYHWEISDLVADTLQAGDSLVFWHPLETKSFKVHLCLENGGQPACKDTQVEILLATTFIQDLKGVKEEHLIKMSYPGFLMIPSRFSAWSLTGQKARIPLRPNR